MSEKDYEAFENYPWWIIAVSIIQQLAIYVIGGFIIYQFGLIWLIVFLGYFAIFELTFYPRACVYCYYYGKWCFTGKGKMALWLRFKQKDTQEFCRRNVTFFSMLPEMLILIVPVILGVVLLVKDFSWVILILLVLDIAIASFGSGFIRGKLACAHCKQGRICCPAREIFGKNR